MIGGGREGVWRILAFVDLSCAGAERAVHHTLALAARLQGEVTLLSVVPRHLYERGVRYEWPPNAFGRTFPEVDIHRVALPGTPAETLAIYADRIGADVLVVPAEYKIRRWLRRRPLAQAVAALTWRPLWIVPPGAGAWAADGPLRVACVLRLDGTDERLCKVAQSILNRCGGELVLTCVDARRPRRAHPTSVAMDGDGALQAMERPGCSLHASWGALVVESCLDAAAADVLTENNIGLIVAGRPTYTNGGANLVSTNRLPCPVLEVSLSSVPTASVVPIPENNANV